MSRMRDTDSEIADRVRGIAAEKRLTQASIAATLRLGRTTVVERMNGRVPFTAAEILTLSVATGVPISRFFPEPAAVSSS